MPPLPCLDDGIPVQHLHFLVSAVSTNRVLTVIVVVLATSNVYFGWTYHQLQVDRTNALGLVLMQATGPLSESVHILNKTIAGGQIDLELWEVLLRDLVEHSRFYKVIASLDGEHGQQWSLIENGIQALVHVIAEIIQACNTKHISLIDLAAEHLTAFTKIRDMLLTILIDGFPRAITLGSDADMVVFDRGIMRAVDSANDLQSILADLQVIGVPCSCESPSEEPQEPLCAISFHQKQREISLTSKAMLNAWSKHRDSESCGDGSPS